MTFGELARAVGTHRSGNHITTGVRVVGTQGERHHRVLGVTVGAVACVVRTRSEVVPQRPIHNSCIFQEVIVRVVVCHGEQAHQVEAVFLGKSVAIGNGVIPSVGEVLILGELRHILVVVGYECVVELTKCVVVVVGGEHRLDLQAFHRCDSQVDIAQRTPSLFLFGAVLHIEQRRHLVGELVLAHRPHGLVVTRLGVDVAVGIVRLHERVHTIGNLDRIIVGVLVAEPREVEIDTRCHILVDSGIDRTFHIDTLLLIAHIHALVLVEANAEVVGHMLAATVDRHIVVLLETRAGYHFAPIGRCAVLHDLFQSVLPRILCSGCGGAVVVESHLLIAGHRINRLSARCHAATASVAEELEETVVVELLCVHEHVHTRRADRTDIHIVRNGRLLLFLALARTGLGAYLNDTCRGTATIDSGRGGVFEHINTRNILRVEPIDIVANDSVHHINRLGVGVGGRLTTDFDVEATTDTSRGLRDAHTGNRTLQRLDNARRTFGSDSVVADRRNGTRQVVFLHLTVTDNHYLIEFLGVFGQGYFDGLLVADRNLLCTVADVGEYEDILCLYAREGIVSVKIGDSTIGRALYLDAHTNQRLAVVVHYRTADSLLSIRQQTRYR